MKKDIVRLVKKCIVGAMKASPTVHFITNEEIASATGCSEKEIEEAISLLIEQGWLDGISGFYCVCVQNPNKID